MLNKNCSVYDLVESSALRKLAVPANIKSGQLLVDTNALEVLTNEILVASARILGEENYIVTFNATPKGLNWHCSCETDDDIFCKHCVAAGVAIRNYC
jgi:uncharacterized Zn finger protein